jgi:hypothetical protein
MNAKTEFLYVAGENALVFLYKMLYNFFVIEDKYINIFTAG